VNLRWELVPYFHGRVLELGCDRSKAYPHFLNGEECGVKDLSKLELFSSKSLDAIFSPFVLSSVDKEKRPSVISEWSRVVKQNGFIVLYLPKEKTNYDEIRDLIKGDLVGFWEDERALFFAFKLGKPGESWKIKPSKPTLGLVRLGAFGDLIQTSSILPWLHERYHLTLYCSDHGWPVIKHDPHIDRVILQARNEVPPEWLEDFWNYTSKKYDRWLNLSESIEGTLLAMSGRANHSWPESVKSKYMDLNYIEFTHELAEVPPPYRPKFYSTLEERAWARKQANQFGKRNVLWSLSGSSVHKTWPHLDSIVARLMLSYPDVHVVLVGDELSQILEAGWNKEKRVHCKSGKWTIRESMAFAEVADLIIGTETGLLNAAGSMETPKIVTLSHSSEHMLTKHWKNTIALSQPKGIGCPKQPCRLLHQNWDHCMKHETGTALCQFEIGPEQMWEAVTQVLENRKAA
jgi:ADP-heptose:LPS heptosyltransferase